MGEDRNYCFFMVLLGVLELLVVVLVLELPLLLLFSPQPQFLSVIFLFPLFEVHPIT
jgi:hypothetical protein